MKGFPEPADPIAVLRQDVRELRLLAEQIVRELQSPIGDSPLPNARQAGQRHLRLVETSTDG